VATIRRRFFLSNDFVEFDEKTGWWSEFRNAWQKYSDAERGLERRLIQAPGLSFVANAEAT